jgi:hypothetical protein
MSAGTRKSGSRRNLVIGFLPRGQSIWCLRHSRNCRNSVSRSSGLIRPLGEASTAASECAVPELRARTGSGLSSAAWCRVACRRRAALLGRTRAICAANAVLSCCARGGHVWGVACCGPELRQSQEKRPSQAASEGRVGIVASTSTPPAIRERQTPALIFANSNVLRGTMLTQLGNCRGGIIVEQNDRAAGQVARPGALTKLPIAGRHSGRQVPQDGCLHRTVKN